LTRARVIYYSSFLEKRTAMVKTVKQYLESLNDGREVWCLADVRTHPTISTIIRTACMDHEGIYNALHYVIK